MEKFANVEMEDYWNEYRTVKGRRAELRGSHSEEDSRSHEDDVDSDDTLLDAVLAGGLKKSREIHESDLVHNTIYDTLNSRQKSQLIRRAQARNLSLRQKRLKVKGAKPDIWSVFSNTDSSSTGTRSRSATPDSLDSLSPPRTPPDPSPKNWVDPHLSRSRASLDSGHHSLITSPSSSFGPVSPSSLLAPSPHLHNTTIHDENGSHHHENGAHHHENGSHHHENVSHHHNDEPARSSSVGGRDKHGREVPDTRRYSPPTLDPNDKYFYPPNNEHNTSKERIIYRAPSLDILSNNKHSSSNKPGLYDPSKDVTVKRQRSYTKELARDVRLYYNNKGAYEFNPRILYDGEIDDVQGLRYQPIGSMHISNKSKNKEHRAVQTEDFERKQDILNSPSTLVRRSHSVKPTLKDPFQPVNLNVNSNSTTNKWEQRVKLENIENNRTRGPSTTDLGFKLVGDAKEEFPELILEVSRSGQTKIEWIDQDDVDRLSSLALLELDILFTENNIPHSWRKRNKKRKNKEVESGVFGACIDTLLEKDKAFLPDPFLEPRVPLIIHKLIKHIELRGLTEEGILRIPGHRARTEELRKNLDTHFYEQPDAADAFLRKALPNELSALVKLFLRDLPQPLLTHSLAPAFYKTHRIEDLGSRVLALTMLIILLPSSYRNTLRVILDLSANVVEHEGENKMGLYNVGMIMAPNIFLPCLQSKSWMQLREDKEQQLNNEMEFARVTTSLTQTLIKYRRVIWTVPHRLVAQVRRQYETSIRNQNSKPIHRLLSRRQKDVNIQRPIANEVDFQNGVLRISAPQFNKLNFPLKLDWKINAKDILTRFIDEHAQMVGDSQRRVLGRREQLQKKRAYGSTSSLPTSTSHSHSPAPGLTSACGGSSGGVTMTTCLMRGSKSHALENHAIHERGGNIVERRIDPCAHLIAIYQDNPNGEFFVRCHHPGGANTNPMPL